MRGIDFLRDRQAEIAARRIVCRRYAIMLVVLLLILVTGVLPLQSMVTSAQMRSEAATADETAVAAGFEKEKELRKELDIRCAQATRFTDARNHTQAWRKVMAEIVKALPEDVWITGISSRDEGAQTILTLSCRATSLGLATDFALALKRSRTFSAASLTTTSHQGGEDSAGVSFDCKVRVADSVFGKQKPPAAPTEQPKAAPSPGGAP